jgi:hypothetical protein
MDRARLGSMLGLLCSLQLAASLLSVVNAYPPWWPYMLWGLWSMLVIASIGLWSHSGWGRAIFLGAGIIFLLECSGEILMAPGSCAGTLVGCYEHYVISDPMLAVDYYLVKLTCAGESVRCYTFAMYLQAGLMVVAIAILLKPLASNNRWRGP